MKCHYMTCQDCEQDGPVCATPPGCYRHWEERNRELVAERDEARSEVKRLQGLMHKAAVTLATTGPKWGHSGDEETGTHDEDCEGCSLEVSIAMLLSGIDQETGGEP